MAFGGLDILSLLLGGAEMYGQNQAYDSARAANEQRYQQGIDLLSGLQGRTMQELQREMPALLQRFAQGTRMGNQDWNQLINRTVQPMRQLGGQTTAGYQQLAQDIPDQYRRMLQTYSTNANDINNQALGQFGNIVGLADRAAGQAGGDYGDLFNRYMARQATGMGLLEGMGRQEGRDIREDYRRRGATQQQSLRSRGLGGTTVGETLSQGNLREQTDALGRLNERLRQQQFGAFSQLSGDALAARERGFGAGERALERQMQARSMLGGNMANLGYQRLGGIMDLRNQMAGAQERLGLGALDTAYQTGAAANAANAGLLAQQAGWGMNRRDQGLDLYDMLNQRRRGYDTQNTMNMLNWIGNRQDTYPDQASYQTLMSSLGSNMAPYPQAQGVDWLSALFQGGASTAATLPLWFMNPAAGAAATATTIPRMFSDSSLKRDIQTADNALGKILGLRGVTFNWKEESLRKERPTSQTGLMADEVEKVFPEWVGRTPAGIRYLDPSTMLPAFIGLAVEAFREIDERLKRLES